MSRSVLLLALGLAGCTLVLDTGKSGLPCGDDGQCLDGYVCDANDVCVPATEGACSPACGAFEKCERQKCVATCEGRPCGAGEQCSGGECVRSRITNQLGDACSGNPDCTTPDAFCLRSYGGDTGSLNMCTKLCGSDADCAGNPDAPTCVAYPTGAADASTGAERMVKICAPTSFTPCTRESDCAPGLLSCGMFSVGPLEQALFACRTRAESGKGIGEICSPSPSLRCANGLCVQTDGSGAKRCLTPCESKSDCAETLTDPGTDCVPVVGGLVTDTANGLPSVRVSMCVPGGASELTSCAPPGSAVSCHADAPNCASLPSGKLCAQSCSDSTPVCPTGEQCDVADGNFCVKSN